MENALAIVEIILIRKPISAVHGISENTLPTIKYNGDPGGCGTPKIYEQAINSPQSQKEVVGAIVLK